MWVCGYNKKKFMIFWHLAELVTSIEHNRDFHWKCTFCYKTSFQGATVDKNTVFSYFCHLRFELHANNLQVSLCKTFR